MANIKRMRVIWQVVGNHLDAPHLVPCAVLCVCVCVRVCSLTVFVIALGDLFSAIGLASGHCTASHPSAVSILAIWQYHIYNTTFAYP